MDSTAITMLAANTVAIKPGTPPLHTLSLVYQRLPKLARERPYVEAILARDHGFVAHRLLGDDLLDFDAFADPPPHDEPYSALWRMSMDRMLLKAAVELGADTVLTGCGADELLDGKPYHFADLLRRGRFLAAWKEASRSGRRTGRFLRGSCLTSRTVTGSPTECAAPPTDPIALPSEP